MNGIKLLAMGQAVPDHIVTNQDLSQQMDTSDQWITSRTGIQQRRHVTTETHSQLCTQAAKQALILAGVKPEEVGVVLVATISGDYLTPSTACLLQSALGLPEDTVCMDVNAACSGFLFALHTAECLLQASARKFGLVIGAEVLSRLINWEDRSTCILFGDGAGAAVVQSHPTYPSICAQMGARGDSQMLTVGGVRPDAPSHIAMEGQAVFKFAVSMIPKCIEAVLSRANLTLDQVDQIVFHQANKRIIDHVVKKLHIPQEQYHLNLASYGNTSAASVPLLLSELYQAGTITQGSKVLCVGFGGGLTWGGAIIEMGERR